VLLLWLAVGGITLSSVLPTRQLPLLLPLLAGFVLVRSGRRTIAELRLPLLLVLLMLWMLASWIWSAERAGSVRSFVDLAGAVSTGVALGAVLDLDRMRRALGGLLKVLIVVNVLALVLFPEFATRPPEGDPVAGWPALLGHKNGFGGFLVLAVGVLVCEAGRRKFGWLLVAFVLLLGSQSASGLGVSLILAAVALWRSTLHGMEQASLRAAARLASLVFLGAGAALLASAPGLVARSFGRSTTLTGRTEIWGAVERQILQHPVLGLGWGGVWRETSNVTQEMWREARFEAYYAHNGYLDVVLQVGAVGAVLYLLLLLRSAQRLTSAEHRSTSFWALLVLLGLCLTAITESSPFTGTLGLLLISMLSTAGEQRGAARQPAPSNPLLPHDDAAQRGKVQTAGV
jgi:O-antigen ligase